MSDKGLYGQGDLYAEKYNTDGTLSGHLVDWENVVSFKITSNNENTPRISHGYADAGSAVGSVSKKVPPSLELMGGAFFKDTWEVQSMGTATDNDGTSVTDEPFTAAHDKPVFIGLPGATIDTDGITDAATGLTVYVEGTDYTYDTQTSMFTALSTGSITDGEALHGDLTKPSTGYKVEGEIDPVKIFRFIIKGKNAETGQNFTLVVHKATVSPTGDVDPLAYDYQQWTLSGTLEVPSGGTSPYDMYYID
jgi:hypothetical protein